MRGNPCFNGGQDCPRRTSVCHGSCPEYDDWKAEHDVQNLEIQKSRDVDGYVSDSIQAMRRGGGRIVGMMRRTMTQSK